MQSPFLSKLYIEVPPQNDNMEEGDKKNIFDHTIFSEEKSKKEESFKDGFSSLGKGVVHIAKGFWYIFSKKFHMNLIVLLLLIGLVIGGFYITGPKKTEVNTTSLNIIFPPNVDTSLLETEGVETIIAENCVSGGLEKTLMDLSCPALECPSCEAKKECPLCICKNESVNMIYYQCLEGNFVKDKKDCE